MHLPGGLSNKACIPAGRSVGTISRKPTCVVSILFLRHPVVSNERRIRCSQYKQFFFLVGIAAIALLQLLAVSAHAQPAIKLADTYQKAWIPTKGTLQVSYKNTGNATLVVTDIIILQAGQEFSLLSPFSLQVIKPGDSNQVEIYYNAQIQLEHNCDVQVLSSDPTHPIVTKHFRINDSIPPNPVRTLRNTPLKAGSIHFSWKQPLPSRDGDPVTVYKLYTSRPGDAKSELLATTLDTQATVHPHGDGTLYYALLAYDDMGNRSLVLDTTWTDSAGPSLSVLHLDDKTTKLPTHVGIGSVGIHLLASDPHLKYIRISYRDTATGSPILTIGEHYGMLDRQNDLFKAAWSTIGLSGMKDLVIYGIDSLGNESTLTLPLKVTQAQGWPRWMPKGSAEPSVATITQDGISRYLIASASIADGLFRPSGDIFYSFYPLSVLRSTSDAVVPISAKRIGDDHLSVITGSQENTLLVLDPVNGRTMSEFGSLANGARLLSFHTTTQGDVITAGVSPVLIHDGNTEALAGASQAWRATGDTVHFPILMSDSGARTFDRFVVGDLAHNGRNRLVRVHDAGTARGEELAVFDASGTLQPGWPKTLWHPTATYDGIYPSLGDLDGDGMLEIIAPAANDSLYVFHQDGTAATGFPTYLPTNGTGHNQALVVDVDGDGNGDIIYPVKDSIVAINGRTGKRFGGFWPIRREGSGKAMLTAAELTSSGKVEIIDEPDLTTESEGAWMYVFEPGIQNHLNASGPGTIQWGTFQHDMRRTGDYSETEPALQSSVHHYDAANAMLNVYPSIATNSVIVDAMPGNLEVTDLLGRIVAQQEMHRNRQALDVHNLPSGIYVVRTQNGSTAKFVKQ